MKEEIKFTRLQICDFIHWWGDQKINKEIEKALWGKLTQKEYSKLWSVDDECDYTLETLKECLWTRDQTE